MKTRAGNNKSAGAEEVRKVSVALSLFGAAAAAGAAVCGGRANSADMSLLLLLILAAPTALAGGHFDAPARQSHGPRHIIIVEEAIDCEFDSK